MVTAEGVIQAGQVPPMFLKKLSHKLSTFSCQKATCTSEQDSAMIDSAIQSIGGHDLIDSRVMSIFRKAITDAQSHIEEAVDVIEHTASAGGGGPGLLRNASNGDTAASSG